MCTRNEETARKILAFIESTFVANHDYVTVDPREFRHLDLKFYDRAQLHLEKQGFRHLADIEDRTISTVPGGVLDRVMIRVMTSFDGAISAGLFHPKIKKLWLRVLLFVLRKTPGRTIDFETEFTDGSFLCTSNAASAAPIALPPLVHAEYWPWNTPVDRLLARHRERVATAQTIHRDLGVRLVRDLAAVHAAQHRLDALKAAYRGEIGGIAPEELAALAPDADPAVLADLHMEIQSELARR